MKTSMLPVSGAEQLNTSEAQPMWPISSASGAYSRLVNPAPRNSSSSCAFGGMNMFQRPPARAFGVLLLVDRHRGTDVLGHEGLHPAEPFLLPVRHREIHETLLTCSSKNWAALSLRHGRAARALMARGVP